jgi:Flp pilus assembly protein CpaB
MSSWSPDAPVRRRLRADVSRALRRHRRLVVALLVGTAAALAVGELRPAPPPDVPSLQASRDLPAGEVLDADDVVVARVPDGGAPAGFTRPAQVTGARLSTPVRAGEPLTPTRLAGPGLLHGQRPGTVALPLRLADPAAAALLRPGDRIDVVAAVPGTGTSTVVGTGLVVLDAPTTGALDDGEALSDRAGLVVLAVTQPLATRLVAAAADAPLWYVLRGEG